MPTNDTLIRVYLIKDNWQTIKKIITETCNQSSADCIQWGKKINSHIDASISSRISETTSELVSLVFSLSNWTAIKNIIMNYCNQRGSEWTYWGRIICHAIDSPDPNITLKLGLIPPIIKDEPNLVTSSMIDEDNDDVRQMPLDDYGLMPLDNGDWFDVFSNTRLDPGEAQERRRMSDLDDGIVWDD
jgi:hypothetical protein